jgi:hypothetical protein
MTAEFRGLKPAGQYLHCPAGLPPVRLLLAAGARSQTTPQQVYSELNTSWTPTANSRVVMTNAGLLAVPVRGGKIGEQQ